MNNVNLVGRITKDVEIRYTQNQNACVMFTLAVNRDFPNPQGQYEADFISCVAWNNQAEFLNKYVKKGYMLGISGRIQTRKYQDQQGQTKVITEVIVNNVENLTPRQQEQNSTNVQQPKPQQQFTPQKREPRNMIEQIEQAPPQVFDVEDDMLPF